MKRGDFFFAIADDLFAANGEQGGAGECINGFNASADEDGELAKLGAMEGVALRRAQSSNGDEDAKSEEEMREPAFHRRRTKSSRLGRPSWLPCFASCGTTIEQNESGMMPASAAGIATLPEVNRSFTRPSVSGKSSQDESKTVLASPN